MTPRQFRKLALALPGAVEAAHCGHPDFRAGKRIFASLAPDETTANLKLTPDQQQECLRIAPAIFSPCAGAWGRWGFTQVALKPAKVDLVRGPLLLAWRNAASPKMLQEFDAE